MVWAVKGCVIDMANRDQGPTILPRRTRLIEDQDPAGHLKSMGAGTGGRASLRRNLPLSQTKL